MSEIKYKSCIEACYECAMMCDSCSIECLHDKHVHKMNKGVELTMYCAEICRLAARFMSMGGQYAEAACGLCAEICEACAAECSKLPHDASQRCAAACRQCAEECRNMVTV